MRSCRNGTVRHAEREKKMSAYCLYLDHSTSDGVSALMKDGKVIEAHYCERSRTRHPCAIWQTLLDAHGLQLKDIAFFACGVGPGSYTGIRSAAATVQAVAFATGKPIAALSSLLLCVPYEEGSYLALSDAGPGGAFVQRVTIQEGQCRVSQAERRSVSAALALIQPDVTPVSVSAEWVRKKVPGGGDFGIRVVPAHAGTAALFAYQEWRLGRVCDALNLSLEYPVS